MATITEFTGGQIWLFDVVLVAIAIVGALILHWLAFRLLGGVAHRSRSPVDDPFVQRAIVPARWLLMGLALAVIRLSLVLVDRGHAILQQVMAIIVPGLVGWLAVSLIRALEDAILVRADISVENNLHARRVRTRSNLLMRVARLVAVFITVCLMLFSIPAVRAVGVTLIASAGLAALAVGAAAQPLLKNIIAGLQLAFTEPIRIDDVVMIDNERGRIEDIRLTYVVIRLVDERRLIVPISRFIEGSFQNWTRSGSGLIGSVDFSVGKGADVAAIRSRYEEIVRSSALWDGRMQKLQVTDLKGGVLGLRGLASARNADDAFDLQSEIREKLRAVVDAAS